MKVSNCCNYDGLYHLPEKVNFALHSQHFNLQNDVTLRKGKNVLEQNFVKDHARAIDIIFKMMKI